MSPAAGYSVRGWAPMERAPSEEGHGPQEERVAGFLTVARELLEVGVELGHGR